MKQILSTFFGGLVVGAISWAIAPLVSGRFEPFDSEVGFYMGQIILCFPAAYLGYKYGMKKVFTYIIGVYIGCITYAYIFGSTQTRSWIGLGMITTLALLVIPLLSGVLGKLFRVGVLKYNKRLQIDTATPRD